MYAWTIQLHIVIELLLVVILPVNFLYRLSAKRCIQGHTASMSQGAWVQAQIQFQCPFFQPFASRSEEKKEGCGVNFGRFCIIEKLEQGLGISSMCLKPGSATVGFACEKFLSPLGNLVEATKQFVVVHCLC